MDPHSQKPPLPTQQLPMEAPPPYPTDGTPMGSSAVQYPQQQASPAPQLAPQGMAAPPYPQQPYQKYPHVVAPNSPAMMGGPAPVVVAQPAVTNVVVTTQSVPLGHGSAQISCPTCHHNVHTHVTRKLKPEAWICCCILCLVGCELCFWIPFVMDSNYTVEHTCPNCRSYVGSAI